MLNVKQFSAEFSIISIILTSDERGMAMKKEYSTPIAEYRIFMTEPLASEIRSSGKEEFTDIDFSENIDED